MGPPETVFIRKRGRGARRPDSQARNSGRRAGQNGRPHRRRGLSSAGRPDVPTAHLPGTPNCECWLHATAKMLLLRRIEDAIAAGADLPVRWSHICPTLEDV